MRNHSGFSLLNMLVFLGGLFLVSAVLFPVFVHRPEYGGRRSSCQSNMMQILLGFKQYTQDYEEYFPPLAARHLPVTTPASSGWVSSLQPYLKSLQIFQCLSETNSNVGFTDYAYNSTVAAGHRERIFTHADDTILMCEADESDGSLASASGPLVANRHLEGSNYAFVDGHVKWLLATKAPTSSSVSADGRNFTFGK